MGTLEADGRTAVLLTVSRNVIPALWLGSVLILTLGYLNEFVLPAHVGDPKGVRILRLNAEQTLGPWFQSLILAFAGWLMLKTFATMRGDQFWLAVCWAVLGAGFIYLSIDEAVSIHEHFFDIAQSVPDPLGLLKYRWVPMGIAIVLAVGAASVPFLLALPRRTAIGLVASGAIFVVGSIGFEMVGSYVLENGLPWRYYQLAFCAEETLEAVGALLVCSTVIDYLSRLGGNTT
jgi:hypothetical protein